MRTQMEAFDTQLQESKEHSLALSEHSRTLMSLTTEFERSFSAKLNSGLQLLDNRLSETLDTSDKMWQRFSLIERGLLSSMNASKCFTILPFALITYKVFQLIARLATSVNQLSDALNSSAHEVMLMNVAQENAVRATDGLIGSLQQMNETVMNALTDINATAIRVNQTIGANFYSFYSIFLSLAGATVLSCEDDHIPLSYVSVPCD
ncbi:hypothetical protein BJV77DRAFT_169255 [Russula vinacea]|nr:hypothetical protein BJV77DRAFT_169255 [Russula vinacea]